MSKIEEQVRLATLQSELEAVQKINEVYSKLLDGDCIHCADATERLHEEENRGKNLRQALENYTRKNSRNAGRRKVN